MTAALEAEWQLRKSGQISEQEWLDRCYAIIFTASIKRRTGSRP